MREHPKELYLLNAMMDLARGIAKASACERAKHGCVFASMDLFNVLDFGYNGPARGLPNSCERPTEQGNCGCIHAELNALLKTHPGPKWAFITCEPCIGCAKHMLQSGVERVTFEIGHRRISEGTQLLRDNGVECGDVEMWETKIMMTGGRLMKAVRSS